jgi:hypothetical protein
MLIGGMFAGGVFGIDQFAVNGDFKAATAGRDERQLLNRVFATHVGAKTINKRLRHTGGTGGVVSSDAKLDANAHGVAPFLTMLILLEQQVFVALVKSQSPQRES